MLTPPMIILGVADQEADVHTNNRFVKMYRKRDSCCHVGRTWAALLGARILTDAHSTNDQITELLIRN